ncbi:MAG TPA: glutamine synthetase family protein [Thermohalobaculum sp.]|nr:glutamine synthetase family protein [Thermohalobaculum sp.]
MTSDALRREAEAFLAQNPGIRHIDAFLIDLCGNAFGKRYPAEDIPALFAEGSTQCAAMQLTDVTGTSWDTLGRGFSDGDPDAPCRPIAGTLGLVPWAPEPRAQCLMRFRDGDGPLWFEPRTVLEGVVARFAELGLRPVAAVELEFYLIDAERTEEGAPQPPRSPVTGRRDAAGHVLGMTALEEFGPVIDAIGRAARAQNLPVTTSSKEYGPGQFEINLAHLDDPVRAADQAALLRRAVVATARAEGFDATFMSKPYGGESGSGLQINLSVEDESGANIFAADSPDGDTRLGHAIAGMQALLPESFAIFAPSFHAFRRFEPDQFTPVTRDWGENNRSVAFRVPASAPAGRRIEHRAAGAEANPYLVMAAVLAAAHHGLTGKLEPTPAGTGNMGAEIDPDLPLTHWAALERLAGARVLPDYLGARYLEAYAHVKQSEFDAFFAEILAREYDWYL